MADERAFGPKYKHIRVGIYDDKVMPAAMLFLSKRCNGGAARFFYDPRYKHAEGEYNRIDIDATRGGYKAVNSVMLRPGYTIQLYEEQGWRGKSVKIHGAYAANQEKDGRLEC